MSDDISLNEYVATSVKGFANSRISGSCADLQDYINSVVLRSLRRARLLRNDEWYRFMESGFWTVAATTLRNKLRYFQLCGLHNYAARNLGAA